jgi:hypothetical protein
MNAKKIVVLLILAVGFFYRPQPPNSNDEIFLYRAVQAIEPGHLPLDQRNIGSCVAVSHAGAIDALHAINKKLFKKFQAVSPESIYGGARNEGRGRISHSYSDGSSGYAATTWLRNFGVTFQRDYGNGLDLSSYNVSRCKEWGALGNGGRPDGLNGPFDSEAKKTPIFSAKVSTLEELDVALKNGFPVTVCSGIGFNSPRDKDGFCQPRGSWSHCMWVAGKRNNGRKGYLIQNSWNAYIKGDGADSSNKYQDQPDGSFYIEPAVMQRILNAGDSWAMSLDENFQAEQLPEWMLNPSGIVPANFATYEEAEVEPAVEAEVQTTTTVTKPTKACVNGSCSVPVFRRGIFRR